MAMHSENPAVWGENFDIVSFASVANLGIVNDDYLDWVLAAKPSALPGVVAWF